MAEPKWATMVQPANMDTLLRPIVRNPDGSISTHRTISVEFDGVTVVLPTVTDDGKIESDDDAIQRYLRTGRHMGMFGDQKEADTYAKWLSARQDSLSRK